MGCRAVLLLLLLLLLTELPGPGIKSHHSRGPDWGFRRPGRLVPQADGRSAGPWEMASYSTSTVPAHATPACFCTASLLLPVPSFRPSASPRLSLRPGAVSLLAAEHSLSISPALCLSLIHI
ncbi:hypothetical protein VFPFJ_10047 [Purpureocillium lilacinum]|uniref:Uncharacterized protein n=1 Tax=Purpureocillium lilacinum TaxID=33203 RepID=A0A179GJG7_PURLI|nr:hypothetical protein VFPFJ_10047 [Purpureocillium lilacinum]OAQ78015.1 hypothetical protein VFPFJ_10047 [Purpureocillium lilacinum]